MWGRAIVEVKLWLDPIDCPACLVVSRAKALRRAGVKHDRYPEFLSRLARLIESGRTIAFVESFALVIELAGVNPYRELKEKLNSEMLKHTNTIRKLIGNDIVRAIEVAAAANAVDIEMLEYKFAGNLIEVLNEKPIYRWVSREKLVHELEGAKRIAYIVDNAGEIIVDLHVVKVLLESGKEVTIYARTLDYETDVTEEDVKRLIRKLGIQVRVVGSGTRYPPHHPMSAARSLLEEADLVIMKGIANYEAFIEAPLSVKTLILLRAKCSVLARQFRVDFGKPVVAMLK